MTWKRLGLIVAVFVACEGAGAILVTFSVSARHLARSGYVRLWQAANHVTGADLATPDRFK